MKLEKVENIGDLLPGKTLVAVEAFGNGPWFHVNRPFIIVEGPTDQVPSSSRVRHAEDVAPAKLPPMAHKWYFRVRSMDNPRDVFAVSFPCENGKIVQGESDYSAFFVHTPEVEQKLSELKTISEYRAFTGI